MISDATCSTQANKALQVSTILKKNVNDFAFTYFFILLETSIITCLLPVPLETSKSFQVPDCVCHSVYICSEG